MGLAFDVGAVAAAGTFRLKGHAEHGFRPVSLAFCPQGWLANLAGLAANQTFLAAIGHMISPAPWILMRARAGFTFPGTLGRLATTNTMQLKTHLLMIIHIFNKQKGLLRAADFTTFGVKWLQQKKILLLALARVVSDRCHGTT